MEESDRKGEPTMQTSQQAFARGCELTEQMVSTFGQLQLQMIVAASTFWVEMLSGQPSLCAMNAVEEVLESHFGEHQVIKLKSAHV